MNKRQKKKLIKARVKAQRKARERDVVALRVWPLLETMRRMDFIVPHQAASPGNIRQRPDGELWWTWTRPSLNVWPSMTDTHETEMPWYLRRESCKQFRHVKPFRIARDASRSARSSGMWPYNPDGSANAAYVQRVEERVAWVIGLPEWMVEGFASDDRDLYFSRARLAQLALCGNSTPLLEFT